jgi:hypothetical protein
MEQIIFTEKDLPALRTMKKLNSNGMLEKFNTRIRECSYYNYLAGDVDAPAIVDALRLANGTYGDLDNIGFTINNLDGESSSDIKRNFLKYMHTEDGMGISGLVKRHHINFESSWRNSSLDLFRFVSPKLQVEWSVNDESRTDRFITNFTKSTFLDYFSRNEEIVVNYLFQLDNFDIVSHINEFFDVSLKKRPRALRGFMLSVFKTTDFYVINPNHQKFGQVVSKEDSIYGIISINEKLSKGDIGTLQKLREIKMKMFV